jgi:hypothetical protein
MCNEELNLKFIPDFFKTINYIKIPNNGIRSPSRMSILQLALITA